MALSRTRIHPGGETFHPWEREAIDFVLAELPDVNPYQAWPIQEFTDPSTGRLYDADLIVLGKHALYYIEIKSHQGELSGDAVDWRFYDRASGRTKTLANPYSLTNTKAKVLKSLLLRHLPRDTKIWVEALVFVSDSDVDVRQLSRYGNERVVRRADVREAITHGKRLAGHQLRHIVNRPLMADVAKALSKLGLRASTTSRLVGQHELGELLDEGKGYQEHDARHRSIETNRARIRSYLVPRATSLDRQAQLRRAAEREAEVLGSLGQHRGILRCLDYVEEAPLGPALLFERFEGASPLDAFLRAEPQLSFDDRLGLIQLIAEALAFCHNKGVLHRNLEPRSVLVRRREKGGFELRLHRFFLAVDEQGQGTRHITAFQTEPGLVYQAPEVLDDPTKASPASDVFGLGALTYLILTGQPPATELDEYDRRLEKDQGFLVSRIRDDIHPFLVEAVRVATDPHFAVRPNDPIEWFDLLLDQATKPAPDIKKTIDPYDARPEDILEGDYLVEKVLGAGSTARVLKVHGADKRSYALKVPHDDGCVERLRAEASTIEGLKHPHIVKSYGMRKIGGRECLLLDFAADSTLSTQLREEGTVGLDFARRYGDDLFAVLEYLEGRAVQHRDIKPANIGFTALEKKQARHLVVFDFSLSDLDSAAVTAGTAAYRDPFLRRRGRWDADADRYAVALVLYQMLTGALPEVGEAGDGSGGGRRVQLEAERFDAALRDTLADFFQTAFQPELSARHTSAADMRTEWNALFAPKARPTRKGQKKDLPESPFDVAALESATLMTAVDALPLSPRARNALERAGVAQVRDLLQLPRNALSAVRAVGRKVANEIQEVAEALRSRLAVDDLSDVTPFAPAYRGPRFGLRPGGALELDAELYYRLRDAGLTTSTELAAVPSSRVENCLGKNSADELRIRLESVETDDDSHTLSDWVTDLLAPKKRAMRKPEKQVRAFLGLDPIPGEEAASMAPEASDVARGFGVTTGTVLRNVTKEVTRWQRCSGTESLMTSVRAIVEAAGGALPLTEVVREAARAHKTGSQEDGEAKRQAQALVRLTTVLGQTGDDGPVFQRISETPWVGVRGEHLDVVRGLQAAARALATTEPLPSIDTVRTELTHAVSDTALAALSADRLATLATLGNPDAALSSRLEIYPRGMAATRALQLSHGVLATAEMTPDLIRERVAQRYPEAEKLPDRPELDDLVDAVGLSYVPNDGVYRRKGSEVASTSLTARDPTRLVSALPAERRRTTPAALEAHAFDEAIRAALSRGRFRVIQAPRDLAEMSAERLADDLGLEVHSLDGLLLDEVRSICDTEEIDIDVVTAADREGLNGEHWTRLVTLMKDAAANVFARLLEGRGQPLLLTHLGLLARYGLDQPLQLLVERAENEEGAAIVVLVPSFDDGQAPSINHTLPVPAPLPVQRLRLPRAWLRREHRAAADEGVGA